jgi:acyl phosphate:glycerol-3-phosphate acyltransferase
MTAPIRPALAVLLGYAAGAVPVSNLAARLLRGVDLRTVGSGTVSGTSLYRVAGFGPLAAAGLLEVGKGAVGPLAAGRDHPLAGALAGALAVTGHNWSPLLGWAGGRGFSPAIGALGVLAWPGAALLVGGLAAGRLLRATAPVAGGAALALVPLAGATHGWRGARAAALVLAPMLAKRLAGNAPAASGSVYLTRLLYDRDVR